MNIKTTQQHTKQSAEFQIFDCYMNWMGFVHFIFIVERFFEPLRLMRQQSDRLHVFFSSYFVFFLSCRCLSLSRFFIWSMASNQLFCSIQTDETKIFNIFDFITIVIVSLVFCFGACIWSVYVCVCMCCSRFISFTLLLIQYKAFGFFHIFLVVY